MQFPIHQEFTHAISKDDPLEPTMAASLQWGKESDEEGGGGKLTHVSIEKQGCGREGKQQIKTIKKPCNF